LLPEEEHTLISNVFINQTPKGFGGIMKKKIKQKAAKAGWALVDMALIAFTVYTFFF
jgi:hypothetical protein